MVVDCSVCEKHGQGSAAQGGVLYEDALVYVGHIHALDGPSAYRGYLMVEPKRHAHRLGDSREVPGAVAGRTACRPRGHARGRRRPSTGDVTS